LRKAIDFQPPPAMNQPSERSEFRDALRKGLLLGAAVLVVILPPMMTVAPPPRAGAPAAPPLSHLADLAGRTTSPEVRQMANWVVQTADNQSKSFVIVDKKEARVYVFNPQGRLQADAPALLGQAHGDDTVPGVGDKPVADVRPEERTTPAGRFVAELGSSSSRGEDVVWVDYNAAVSMHRVLNVPARLKALASPTKDDNRMSYGCINLPPSFYEGALRPAVQRTGAVIYVLPETRSLQEQFAAFYDVTSPVKLAQH
jgi:hypothetical protein